ncbi:hypothetical protein KUCAC02_029276 [Chaenocephalus aceratus]|uniref:Uncharacterized protein n=1 Tax=Chaenocephalus aceratus TaxID=36190 RepID=A0ACB9X4A5_CHAAC|nr:hypothetical protein KUCAC02_029276 [Chaenocephalus aceratus]
MLRNMMDGFQTKTKFEERAAERLRADDGWIGLQMKQGLIFLAAQRWQQEAYRDATEHQSQFAAASSDKSEALLLIYGPLMACQYMDPPPSLL